VLGTKVLRSGASSGLRVGCAAAEGNMGLTR
jgi:hypothetical protein